jgi:hypothetical protein
MLLEGQNSKCKGNTKLVIDRLDYFNSEENSTNIVSLLF